MQAAQRLRDTLRWRAAEADPPETRACALCLKDASAHYLHPVGFCRRRRPVLYRCPCGVALTTECQRKVYTFPSTFWLLCHVPTWQPVWANCIS